MKKRPAVPHFIEEEREKGSSDQEIRHKLLDAGWHMDIIHRAMNEKDAKPARTIFAKHKNSRQTAWQKINPVFLMLAGVVIVLSVALFA